MDANGPVICERELKSHSPPTQKAKDMKQQITSDDRFRKHDYLSQQSRMLKMRSLMMHKFENLR